MTPEPAPPPSLRLVSRLASYLRPYRRYGYLAVAAMLLTTVSTAAMVYLLKPFADGTFGHAGDPSEALKHLRGTILPLLALAIAAKSFFSYFQGYWMGYLSQRMIQDIRKDLYARLTRLPMSYFSGQRSGGLTSRIINDVFVLQNIVLTLLGNALSSVLSSLGLMILLFYLNVSLALAALAAVPLVLAPMVFLGRRIRGYAKEGQGFLAEMGAHIQETLSGIRLVKGYGMEGREQERLDRINDSFFRVTMKLIQIVSLSGPLIELTAALLALPVIAYVAYQALILKSLSIGDFAAFAGAVSQLYPNLKTFNGLWGSFQQAMGAAERCFDLLDTPDALADPADAVAVGPLRRAIEFKNVGFEYQAGEAVLRGVSLRIQKGEAVALVGPTGSGKTTLADLVAKFYLPTRGSILWDGRDLRGAKAESLRSQIGLITQDTILFYGTIRENIAYGRPDAGDEEVRRAAEQAQALGFIQRLPKGFDTVVGERGMKLSGGQRQCLSIARALMKDPPLFILDEATSSLDAQSERLVQKAIDALMRKRTLLVIAHRLSTVRRADRILVLDRGRIVEKGGHAQLLRKNGLYSRLYKMQFRNA